MSTTLSWDNLGSLSKYGPLVLDHLTRSNATTTQNELYGGVDLLTLNWFERVWAGYYILMGNEVIATGLMSFLMHEVSHLVGFIQTVWSGIVVGLRG